MDSACNEILKHINGSKRETEDSCHKMIFTMKSGIRKIVNFSNQMLAKVRVKRARGPRRKPAKGTKKSHPPRARASRRNPAKGTKKSHPPRASRRKPTKGTKKSRPPSSKRDRASRLTIAHDVPDPVNHPKMGHIVPTFDNVKDLATYHTNQRVIR